MKKNSTASPGGLWVALSIILLWLGSLVILLSASMSTLPLFVIIPGILLQTFLYTGLFITAHDAMHGTVTPGRRRLNDFIGALCVVLYAIFSFKRLRGEHRKHHAHPGSDDDPDFHDARHPGFWRWYMHFVLTYVTWRQIAGMAIVFNVLERLLEVPVPNLVLFWVLPSLLSTLQLFYFGTYLPHREPARGYDNAHHARSNDFSVLWSFVTCYHFGYHLEHHEHPGVPWWRLPAVRAKALEEKAGKV